MPLFTVLVLVPLGFIVIGPVTNFVGNVLANVITTLLNLCPPVAGFLMASLWPVMIIFGVHWAFIPVGINNMMRIADSEHPMIGSGRAFPAGNALLFFFPCRRRTGLGDTI